MICRKVANEGELWYNIYMKFSLYSVAKKYGERVKLFRHYIFEKLSDII